MIKSSSQSSLTVRAWGDYALFTRPEFKTERVSYQVMTPSAARGVLEAIFWKPEMSWRIREIQVLKPIRHFSILRNEVNSHQSERAARNWARSGDGGYYADEDRSQRHALCLRDVAYVIKADIELRGHATEPAAKYRDQFRRRVARGQCHHQPYFGTRECTAYFDEADSQERPISLSDDLGLMLLDVDFQVSDGGNLEYLAHDGDGARVVQGNATPRFFQAQLVQGVLTVPSMSSLF